MPPKSAAFLRIKSDVMAIARTIPEGRVTTFSAIGDYLEVMPRHVAYLLAQRNDEEREAVPWHRVVGNGGALGTPKRDFHGESQADLLADEGVEVGPGMKVVRFDDLFFPITLESTGIAPTPRESAPPARPRRRP